jgi:prepilin-type N-terminal cleavage/methylation domain-containing protein
MFRKKGFTLLELLIVMGILGVLASVLVVAINPTRQFAKARDVQRESDLQAIVSVIFQYASEHSGSLPDTDDDPETSNFPTSMTCIGTGAGCFDLAGAGETGDEIVPVYMVELPKDPKLESTGNPGTDADTGYKIYADTNGHVHASASGETKTIGVQR